MFWEPRHPKLCEPSLPGAEQFPGSAYAQIRFRNHKTIVGILHDLQSFLRCVR